MKKIISIIIIAAMLLSLCACSSGSTVKAENGKVKFEKNDVLSLSAGYKDLLGDQTVTMFTDNVITLPADESGSIIQLKNLNALADTDFDLQSYELTENGCKIGLRYISYSINYLSEEITVSYTKGGTIEELADTCTVIDDSQEGQKIYLYDDGMIRYNTKIVGLGMITQEDGYTVDVMYRQFVSDGSQTDYCDPTNDETYQAIYYAVVKEVHDNRLVLAVNAPEDAQRFLPSKLVMAEGEDELCKEDGLDLKLKQLDYCGWNEDLTEMYTGITVLDNEGKEVKLSLRNGAAMLKYAADGQQTYSEWDEAYTKGEADPEMSDFLGIKAASFGDGFIIDLGQFDYYGNELNLYYYVEIED